MKSSRPAIGQTEPRPTEIGTVVVIAKEPLPGRVKTRLTPPFTPHQSAALAAAALADTLAAAAKVPAEQYVLALDGRRGDWVPAPWRVIAQSGGGLDARLGAAFAAVGAYGPAVLVGMDTPQLHPDQVRAFRPSEYDCCIGLAQDGGFWAIGFRDPYRAEAIIAGVPMSREDTGARQLERLMQAGLRTQFLDELVDVDTVTSAHQAALAAPSSAFANQLRAIQI